MCLSVHCVLLRAFVAVLALVCADLVCVVSVDR